MFSSLSYRKLAFPANRSVPSSVQSSQPFFLEHHRILSAGRLFPIYRRNTYCPYILIAEVSVLRIQSLHIPDANPTTARQPNLLTTNLSTSPLDTEGSCVYIHTSHFHFYTLFSLSYCLVDISLYLVCVQPTLSPFSSWLLASFVRFTDSGDT